MQLRALVILCAIPAVLGSWELCLNNVVEVGEELKSFVADIKTASNVCKNGTQAECVDSVRLASVQGLTLVADLGRTGVACNITSQDCSNSIVIAAAYLNNEVTFLTDVALQCKKGGNLETCLSDIDKSIQGVKQIITSFENIKTQCGKTVRVEAKVGSWELCLNNVVEVGEELKSFVADIKTASNVCKNGTQAECVDSVRLASVQGLTLVADLGRTGVACNITSQDCSNSIVIAAAYLNNEVTFLTDVVLQCKKGGNLETCLSDIDKSIEGVKQIITSFENIKTQCGKTARVEAKVGSWELCLNNVVEVGEELKSFVADIKTASNVCKNGTQAECVDSVRLASVQGLTLVADLGRTGVACNITSQDCSNSIVIAAAYLNNEVTFLTDVVLQCKKGGNLETCLFDIDKSIEGVKQIITSFENIKTQCGKTVRVEAKVGSWELCLNNVVEVGEELKSFVADIKTASNVCKNGTQAECVDSVRLASVQGLTLVADLGRTGVACNITSQDCSNSIVIAAAYLNNEVTFLTDVALQCKKGGNLETCLSDIDKSIQGVKQIITSFENIKTQCGKTSAH